jgi:cysteine desulfuration protein SufE
MAAQAAGLDKMTTRPDIASIEADFDLLDEWEDRYRYVIELGRKLPPLSADAKTDTNKVRGCASQVWIATEQIAGSSGQPALAFTGESDSHIVQGLIAILLALVDRKSAQDILATDIEAQFAKLGLREHLTPQRSNGLASMVARVRADAAAALSKV